MNAYTPIQTRIRLAALGAATMMTLVVLAGIGTLAEVQPAGAVQALVQPVQQVVVVGQRGGRI